MVNKDYEKELRQEILGWYAPCKIRFYRNSVTVTLSHPCTSTGHLQQSVNDFISQFEEDITLRVIAKSSTRFSLTDVKQSASPTPVEVEKTDLEQLFTDWLEELDDDEEFDDEDFDDLYDDDGEILADRLPPFEAVANTPINSREELLDMLRNLEVERIPTLSLEERAIAVQQEVIEAELASFLKVNVEHAIEVLPLLAELTINPEHIKTVLTFGFLAGKWSATTMRDMNAIMNVWGKYFGEETSTIGL